MYLTSELNVGDNPLVDSYSLQGWGGGNTPNHFMVWTLGISADLTASGS